MAFGLDFSCLNESCKMREGSVVGGFGVCRKDASGQLAHFLVVGNTLTAVAFARSGIICAGASAAIFFLMTFHAGSLGD